jgi:hypothetical protein
MSFHSFAFLEIVAFDFICVVMFVSKTPNVQMSLS